MPDAIATTDTQEALPKIERLLSRSRDLHDYHEESTIMNTMIKAGVLATLATLAACGTKETTRTNPADSGAETTAVAADADARHSATGTVQRISGKEVTIAHDAIKSIGWPAMEMTFTANDAAALKGISKNDRVSFEFQKSGSAPVLTSIHKR